MPLQASGQISFTNIAGELSITSTNASLRSMSSRAGKTTPDFMSDFYGYDNKFLMSGYYLIAGGGGGGRGNNFAGGGGGGGYINSWNSSVSLDKGIAYPLTVGTGGPASPSSAGQSTNGTNSVFHTFTAIGGGRGASSNNAAGNGGSGGGAAYPYTTGGSPTAGQGFSGGNTFDAYPGYPIEIRSGGGGGAAGPGVTSYFGESYITPNGGPGHSLEYPLSDRGGGGGGSANSSGAAGFGGSGGGGTGSPGTNNLVGASGGAQQGGGGGGGLSSYGAGSGGSGIILIKIPSSITPTFTAGVTQSLFSNSGGIKIYSITAAGVSDTVTFS